MNKKNLKNRILTGLLGGSLLLFSSLHEWSYFSAFIIIIFLSSSEFFKILGNNNFRPNNILGIFLSVLIFLTVYLYSSKNIIWGIHFLLVPILPIVCLSALYSSKNKQTISNVSVTFFGILYISIPISLLNFIVFDNGEYQSTYLLATLLFLWTSESSAYIGGSLFGKTKLFESVSPMKTWEGVFFGLISNLILAYFLHDFFGFFSYYFWAIFSVVVLVSGIFGDLFESLLKRNFNIKDSGNKLPGHGGFLDRFDSFFFVIPYVYFFLKIVDQIT
ncbi:MAG: phosphatidate cytidylyltransferase [Bacteroidota bacterium]|nr:phosphatidate cytidylyltransferase [Bacteroidota bacterium]